VTPLLPVLAGEQPPSGFLQKTVLLGLQSIGRLYGLIQAARAFVYKAGIFTSYSAPCSVISVGNLTAGGTGKTPMVLWLAKYFQDQGRQVAVVSRGYRQQSKKPVTIVADPNHVLLNAPQAADEAVLIAQKLPGVTVLTGPDRRKTIALATQKYGCDLIIMDDAFQHLQVRRQLDLLLLDCNNPFGNGEILPGGMLREFPSALRRCDGLIITRADDPEKLQSTKKMVEKIDPKTPICHAIHQPTGWIKVTQDGQQQPTTITIDQLKNIPVLAFCGIAKPAAFEQTINNLSLSIKAFQPFTDHHIFDDKTIDQLLDQAEKLQAQALVCTEKDAVKIQAKTCRLPIYALSLELHLPKISPWLIKQLDTI
jgi:tetraacyldisaccharide 4'-kinase